MSMEVDINYKDPLDLIEPNYPGDCERQKRIYLEIDWSRKKITAYTYNFKIGGTPSRIWHGLADIYQLPCNTDASKIKEWVEQEVIPRIKPLEDAFESYWDGSNWRGKWKDDADVETIYDDFNDFMSSQQFGNGSVPAIMDSGGVWDVYDWLQEPPKEITADTTDE